jgi:hypothetical protein
VRVLLDEQVPIDLAPLLVGHEVQTVAGLGWAGLKNGELLRRAGGQFTAFVTLDRNLEFQQNLAGLSLSVVLVRAPSNRLVHLRPLIPAILGALDELKSGEVRRVGV